jgi:hypothetical protein
MTQIFSICQDPKLELVVDSLEEKCKRGGIILEDS